MPEHGGALHIVMAPDDPHGVNGPEVLVRDHLARLSEEVFGHCTVASNRVSAVGQDIRKTGHTIHLLPWTGLASGLAFMRALGRLLATLRPALVVSHGALPLDFLVTKACRRRGCPVMVIRYVARADMRWSPWKKALWAGPDDWVLAHADAVAFAGFGYADRVGRRLRLDARRCRFIPVPVDLERFHPRATESTGPPLILGVGQLTANKDWPTFVRTLAALTRWTDFRARIVGSGPEESGIRRLVRRLDLDERMSMLSFSSDMAAQYRDASVYLSTSLREGLSIAAAEACSSGLPLVLTGVSGSEVLVRDGKNGFVVAPAHPGLAARAVQTILRDPDTRRCMSRASRRIAEAKFAAAQVLREYADLMDLAAGRDG